MPRLGSFSSNIFFSSPQSAFKLIRTLDNPNAYGVAQDDFFANSIATSEDFIRDFMQNIECDYLFQIHTIAPLVTTDQISDFVDGFVESQKQVGLSYEKIILESLIDEQPINFDFQKKENSQDLKNVHVINWAMTAWKVDNELIKEDCISYGSNRYYHEIPKIAGLVIKTHEDYIICKKLLEH